MSEMSDSEEDDPFSRCSVECFTCKKPETLTDREYTSENGVINRGIYYNFGRCFPVTKCCDGPICSDCAMSDHDSEIFCKFCGKSTTVHFLSKAAEGLFSERTNSRFMTTWFIKLWESQMVQDKLGATCQFFFYWLRNHCLEELGWSPDLYSWHDLCLDKIVTQRLMRQFGIFTNISQMVVAQIFFLERFKIRMKSPSPFECISSTKQEQIRISFLHAWYDLSFSSSIKKKKLLKQNQIGFVGTLSARLSISNQDCNHYKHYFLRTIFSRVIRKPIFS
jgi:hypothetical protein